MDENAARLWVENILDRLVPTEGGRGYRLDGLVTKREFEALSLLLRRELASQHAASVAALTPNAELAPLTLPPALLAVEDTPAAPALIPVIAPAKLDRQSLTASPEAGILACIDFGTAFSKAAVWREGEPCPIPLDLEQAGTGQAGFMIPSSVYVTGGSVYFGARALEESRRENNPDRERFDSPKQCLSIDDPDDIDRERVGAALDPTGTFTRGDLLRLYLAYLTSCMAERLEEHGLSR